MILATPTTTTDEDGRFTPAAQFITPGKLITIPHPGAKFTNEERALRVAERLTTLLNEHITALIKQRGFHEGSNT